MAQMLLTKVSCVNITIFGVAILFDRFTISAQWVDCTTTTTMGFVTMAEISGCQDVTAYNVVTRLRLFGCHCGLRFRATMMACADVFSTDCM